MKKFLYILLYIYLAYTFDANGQFNCETGTMEYVFDLSARDSMTVTLNDLKYYPDTLDSKDPNIYRCCGLTGKQDYCIKFKIKIHPDADYLTFSKDGGPWGSDDPWIGSCGTTFDPTAALCIKGQTYYEIAFCKTGKPSKFDFTISSVNEVEASPDVTISSSCRAVLSVNSLITNTIIWNAVTPEPDPSLGTFDYNSLLSYKMLLGDTVKETIYVDPPPAIYNLSFLDIAVSGDVASTTCTNLKTSDTVRVNFVNDKTLNITRCSESLPTLLLANITGGAPPFEYRWKLPDGSLFITTDSFLNITEEAIYSLEVRDTTFSAGCPALFDTIDVSNAALFYVSPGADTATCGIAPITFTGQVLGTDKIKWSTNGKGTFSDTTALVTTYTPHADDAASGFVNITLTAISLCSNSDSTITLFFRTPTAPKPLQIDSICGGSNITLTADTDPLIIGQSFLWSSGETSISVNVNPTITTTYGVEINDGCTRTDSFRVYVYPSPSDSISIDTFFTCYNAPITISGVTASDFDSLRWTDSEGRGLLNSNTLTPTFTPVLADTGKVINLSLTVFGTNNCSSTTDSVFVSVGKEPVISMDADSISMCFSNPVSIDAGSLAYLNNIDTSSIEWYSGSTLLSNTSTLLYTPVEADSVNGWVDLTISGKGISPCNTVTKSTTLRVYYFFNNYDTINAQYCPGVTIQLPDSSWITTTTSQTYTSVIPTTSPYLCDSIIITNITVYPFYNLTRDTAICFGSSFTLSNGLVVSDPGTYPDTTRTLFGCDSTLTTTVTILAPPIVSIDRENDISCFRKEYILPTTSVVSSEPYTIAWDHTGNGYFNEDTTAYITTDANDSINGVDLILTAFVNNACISRSDTMHLDFKFSKVFYEDTFMCQGDEYILIPGNTVVTNDGKFNRIFQGYNSCDSTVVTTLKFLVPQYDTIIDKLCEGIPYNFPDNSSTSTPGSHTIYIKYQNAPTCDSLILTYILTQTPRQTITLSDSASNCWNNSFPLSGDTATNYVSIQWTSTEENIPFSNSFHPVYEPSDNDSIRGFTFIKLTVVGNAPCPVLSDSIKLDFHYRTTTNVSLNPICEGDSAILPNGIYIKEQGIYSVKNSSIHGCDSFVNYSLTVKPVFNTKDSSYICQGEPFSWENIIFDTSIPDTIVKTAVLQSIIYDCDSTVVYTLFVQPSYNLVKNDTFCLGNTYTLPGGDIVSFGGTYIRSFETKGIHTCDSIITTNLLGSNLLNLLQAMIPFFVIMWLRISYLDL